MPRGLSTQLLIDAILLLTGFWLFHDHLNQCADRALINAGQDSAQIEVTVIIKGLTTIVNTATVSSLNVDPNKANNS